MPLILKAEEIEALKNGLQAIANFEAARGRQIQEAAKKLLAVLQENPDCKVWVIMTEEEREGLSNLYQTNAASNSSRTLNKGRRH